MKMFVALAALASFAAPALADDFTPGRPGNTESPISVPAGRWQVESELAGYAHASGAESWSVLQTDVRYGVADGWDVEAILSPLNGDGQEEGVGDATLRVRHTFAGQDGDGPAFALIGFVTLPTATNGQGDGAFEGGAIATGAFELNEKTGATWTLGAAAISDAGVYKSDLYGGVAVSRQLTGKLGCYIEPFVDRQDHQTAGTVDLGVTYLANANTQWDAGVDIGVTNAADDARVFVGWAHLF